MKQSIHGWVVITIGSSTLALVAGQAFAQNLTCASDLAAQAELPLALRAEQPLIAFAARIDLVPGGGSRGGQALTTLSVSPAVLTALNQRLAPGAPTASFAANTPTVRVDSGIHEQVSNAPDLQQLNRLFDKTDGLISGPKRSERQMGLQRVIGSEESDAIGKKLPTEPQQPPSLQTAPWVSLSADEVARRTSGCTQEIVNELEAAGDQVTSGFGYEKAEASMHMREFVHASTDARSTDRKRAAASRYVKAYSAMLEKCTRPASSSPTFGTSGLQARIGVLQIGDDGICTALLVGPRHVLTARHCLFSSKHGGLSLSNTKVADLWIALDKPLQRAQICAVTNPGPTTAFPASSDYLLLRIANTGRTPPPTAMANQQGLRDGRNRPSELISFSLFPGSDLLGRGSPLGLVEYTGGACLVFKKRGGCYYHGCGAQAGSSGAPLFLRDEFSQSQIVLAGLHIGPASSTPDCPATAFDETNVGNVLPSTLLVPFAR